MVERLPTVSASIEVAFTAFSCAVESADVSPPSCVDVILFNAVAVSPETCAVERLATVSASSEVLETAFSCVVVSPCVCVEVSPVSCVEVNLSNVDVARAPSCVPSSISVRRRSLDGFAPRSPCR